MACMGGSVHSRFSCTHYQVPRSTNVCDSVMDACSAMVYFLQSLGLLCELSQVGQHVHGVSFHWATGASER